MLLYLASASPRRKQLLELAGLKPRVVPSRVLETCLPREKPQAMVQRLAHAKAAEVRARLVKRGAREGWVLGADTTVVLGRERVLEKPRDEAEAVAMLKALSGRVHRVVTGVSILPIHRGMPTLFAESTRVWFRRLKPAEITAYVRTGEPMDKAGAYAIQGGAAAFVRKIEGDYSNVVGLPLSRVVEALAGAK
jgi:septum formation protein